MMRELSLHILDLVQNGIEAGASTVSLEIIEDRQRDVLIIRVSDNGRGMDEATVKRVIDPFVTSRTTRKIGLGLPLIDMSTKLCGGYMTIDSKLGQGTTVEAAFQYSHLDRPPLGNMVETAKSILIGAPELDFRYIHTVNEQTFEFKTQEIVEALGDVPLTQPDVLIWIHEYLASNIAKLYGGAN